MTLELVDETKDVPQPMGESATLHDDGKVTYEGDGVRQILVVRLRGHTPEDVFKNMRDWSNGYISLRERK